jgi:hypothetical protein
MEFLPSCRYPARSISSTVICGETNRITRVSTTCPLTQSRAVGSAEKNIFVGCLASQRKLFLKYVHVFGVSALLPDRQMKGEWNFIGIIDID